MGETVRAKDPETYRIGDFSDVPLQAEPLGTYVSLYAGAGGLDLGFTLAGFVPVWVNEYDRMALETHELALKRMRDERPHLRNMKHESIAGDLLSIPESELPEVGSADLVIGGPPCQGFSVAGKMDPADARSEHIFHFMDVVAHVQPRAFVLENVKALYQNTRWEAVRRRLIHRAEELGYDALLTLANASHFGVPQARERMFLIGIRSGLGVPLPPVPTTIGRPPSVRDALRTLPAYLSTGNDSTCAAKITTAKSPVLRRSPYAGMLFNGAGRPLNLDAPATTLAASMGGNKTPIIDQAVLEGTAETSWVADYHQALWNYGHRHVVESVPKTLRRITVEEAAAIQTFPIGMDWAGSQSLKYRQIGNAVPPRLALAVAEAVKVSLGLVSR